MTIEVGDKFGELTVTRLKYKDARNKKYWLCTCSCGNSRVVRDDVLKLGNINNCGNRNLHITDKSFEDLTGREFGEWQVISLGYKDSHNRVFWRCRCLCGYEKDIRSDTLKSGKSTFCHKLNRHPDRKTHKKSISFYDWAINDDWGKELLKEARFDTKEYTAGSNSKVLWECKNKHKWNANIANRRYLHQNCPICKQNEQSKIARDSKIKYGLNDVETWCKNNGDYGKQIIDEYTGINGNGKRLELKEIGCNSVEKLRWKCKINPNHIWDSYIYNRIVNKSGCPYCSGTKVDKGRNDLLTWCNTNKDQGNNIIADWTGEDEYGNRVAIDNISFGSSIIFKWVCNKNKHIFFNTIADRTYRNQNCPYCSTNGTSYSEQFIYYSLLQIWNDTLNRIRVNKSVEHPMGIEYDIVVPSKKLCIEYGAVYWHKDKAEKDQFKQNLCINSGGYFISIIETSDIDTLFVKESDDKFIINSRNRMVALISVIANIVEMFNGDISNIDFEQSKLSAYDRMRQ